MISHGNLMGEHYSATRPHQGNGLNNLRTSSPVLKTSVRRPCGDKTRHMRPPAVMVRIAYRSFSTGSSVEAGRCFPTPQSAQQICSDTLARWPTVGSSGWPPPLQRPSRRLVRTSFWLPCPPPDARAPHGLATIGVAACPRPRDERGWRKDSQKKFLF